MRAFFLKEIVLADRDIYISWSLMTNILFCQILASTNRGLGVIILLLAIVAVFSFDRIIKLIIRLADWVSEKVRKQ